MEPWFSTSATDNKIHITRSRVDCWRTITQYHRVKHTSLRLDKVTDLVTIQDKGYCIIY